MDSSFKKNISERRDKDKIEEARGRWEVDRQFILQIKFLFNTGKT